MVIVPRSSAKMSLEEAIAAACSMGWLAVQDAEFQQALCATARLRSYQKNEALYHIEDEAPEIYCMVHGVALIQVVHPVVGLLAGHVIRPGEWFGEPATLGRRPRLVSVQARGRCQVLTVPRKAIDGLIATSPGRSQSFFDLLASNTEAYMLHAMDLLIRNPKLRVGSRLLTLAGRRMTSLPSSPVAIPLSQEELALTCSLSRQSVSQILSEFVEAGICAMGYRKISILDVEALVRLQDDASG